MSPEETYGKSFPEDGAKAGGPDHLAFEEDIFIENYVLDRVSSAEAERFERHFLDCPVCLERLETTQAMLESFRHGAVTDASRVVQGAWLAALESFWRRSGGARVVAALAVCLLVVATGWSTWQATTWRRQAADLAARWEALEQSARQPLQIRLSRLRDASSTTDTPAHRFVEPVTPRWLMVELELGLPAGTPCRVSYVRAGSTIWQNDTLVVDGDGRLRFPLISSVLPVGDGAWVVEEPSGSEGVVGRFPWVVEQP